MRENQTASVSNKPNQLSSSNQLLLQDLSLFFYPIIGFKGFQKRTILFWFLAIY